MHAQHAGSAVYIFDKNNLITQDTHWIPNDHAVDQIGGLECPANSNYFDGDMMWAVEHTHTHFMAILQVYLG